MGYDSEIIILLRKSGVLGGKEKMPQILQKN
jgi:hypothetical protein